MLGHYLKIAGRHLLKHKGHSLINILGLALGMACCLLILLFLRYELSYDRFHPAHERVFRVTQDWQNPGGEPEHWASTPHPLGPTLAKEMPEIVAVTRLRPYPEGSLPGKVAVSYRNERQFYDQFYWADADTFRVLGFELVKGDPETALAGPNQVVLPESTARRYFGDEDPMGKVLRIDTNYSDEDYRITGVMRDVPGNTHFSFDVLASFSSLDHVTDQRVALDQWWLAEPYTYVRLADGVDPRTVEAKFPALVEKHLPKVPGIPPEKLPKVGFRLQPISDIHLYGHMSYEMQPNGDIAYFYIFSAIAALTLLVACVNFMNLATARFAGRAREVGVRKVVGAHRSQLIAQFLGESLLLCTLSMVLAVILVYLTLPAFSAFSGKQIELRFDAVTWLGLLGLTVLVGLIAGSYPALFLSGFRPVQVLKSSLTGGVGSGAFRRLLIVSQFAISVGLLIGAAIIYDQLRYMRSQELGLDLENVVGLPIRDVELRNRYLSLKEDFERIPNVDSTTFSSLIIGRELPDVGMMVAGRETVDEPGSLVVDQGFLEVFRVPLVAGRPLAKGEDKDKGSTFLVNEAMVRHWGMASPQEALGAKLNWGGWKQGEIVGVVRDFHARPLQFEVGPVILHIRPIAFHYLYVRIAPEDRAATLREIERVWRQALPSKPFEYFFLDDEFSRYYRAEERLAKLVGFFALAAVLVACLGLLGLASFTAEKRTREIGIRKVLGSSVGEVVFLLSKELTIPVLLANLIAWPVVYFLLRDWLQSFAYRTEIHLSNFILGGLAALVIAWLTVSYQALKAALIDPAEALRYE
jgi:putative ABC transport system permease protein